MNFQLAAIVQWPGGVRLEDRPHLTTGRRTLHCSAGRVSVKKARRMNDLLIGSLLHFLALCVIQTLLLLCSVKVMCGYTHHGRKSCQSRIVRFDVVLPHAQLYLFFSPLKSFNYFFCILAALSVERYIPLLE